MKDWAQKFYKSTEWKKVRAQVLKRDHYLCQNPNCWNPATIVHHKILLTADNVNDPAISLNPSHLVSLCQDCHNAIHTTDRFHRYDGILEQIMFDVTGQPVKVDAAQPDGLREIQPKQTNAVSTHKARY